jgi:hypothetical protein
MSILQPKKLTRERLIGQQGINLIERTVLEMGSRWSPEILDVGLDGIIELCDPITRSALGVVVQVQSKATAKRFERETATQLEYTCDQRDLDYWLQCNTPVILVISRPATSEAYWISIKDYFREPIRRQSGKVTFSKIVDRFDANSWHALRHMAVRRENVSPHRHVERQVSRRPRKLASSGLYLFAMSVFLLPVVSVSCRDHTIRTVSGPDLVSGSVFRIAPITATLLLIVGAWLLVTLVLPAIGLVINVVDRRAVSRLADLWPLVVGCAGLLVVVAVFLYIFHLNAVYCQRFPDCRAKGPLVEVEPAAGLWLEAVVLPVVAALGLVLSRRYRHS